MHILLEFKQPSLEEEFYSDNIDPRLRAMILGIALFTTTKWQKRVLITCLVRTPENNAVYGGKPTSAHVVSPCRAADLRSFEFLPEEIQEIEKYFTDTWGPMGYYEYHTTGKSPLHIHIQIVRAYARNW